MQSDNDSRVAAFQVASVAVAQQVLTESGAIFGVLEIGWVSDKGVPFATSKISLPRSSICIFS